MTAPKEPLPDRFWLTRDSILGRESEDVDVWSCRPTPDRSEHGDVFYGTAEEIDQNHLGQWSLVEAKKRYAGAPDSHREVICIGKGS